MFRFLLVVTTLLLPLGCKSREAKSYYSRHGKWVDVDVRKGSVDVRVDREDSEDVDVNISWP